MTKKILTSIFIVLLLAVLGLGIYFFFSRQNSSGQDFGQTVRNFFPFGRNSDKTLNDVGSGAISTTTPENPIDMVEIIPRLREVSSEPTAGATAIDTPGKTTIRFVERATGHVFETSTDSLSLIRISNTTIPKIYSAVWAEGGNAFIAQYLKDDGETIETIHARIEPASQANLNEENVLENLEITFLTPGIKSFAVSPKQNQIFFLSSNPNGASGILAKSNGDGKSEIFSSTFGEWSASWPSTKIIALTSKPSADVPGYLYFLDPKTESFQKIMGGQRGLTALVSPDGGSVLFYENTNVFSLLSILERETSKRIPLSLLTLPEKCVWSALAPLLYCAVPKAIEQGAYPDDWYKGLISFSDDIWRINIETGQQDIVASLKDLSGKDIDATNLILNERETYLLFLNKKDSSLWSLGLREEATPEIF